ncbi:hypothetical protein M3936_19435 [Sutcliffiella horikoshii]|uniref:hypothetical protein n=1 Tax=Sutcliffiella horikoshii TaxID=79883 RepID=UPI00203D63ED|nr:hypothetical protein [Sutcliffiella horikoshii]MCM3619747.1 hypothetical protein [Sutcliffiella horikoshii]
MKYEFHTSKSCFLVDNNRLFKDGDLIAEGTIFPFQVLLGLPAILIVSHSEYCPPQFLKTDTITSVLAANEYLDGETAKKYLFEISYKFRADQRDQLLHFLIPGVDTEHAKSIFTHFLPEAVIEKITQQTGKSVA